VSCNVFVSDDRFFNQNLHFSADSNRVSIVSTLGIVNSLAESAQISETKRFECVTRLRQAGFLFVPITINELSRHLQSVREDYEPRKESAELKAIRENVLLARMSNVLQAPQEVAWVEQVIQIFIRTVRELWVSGGDVDKIRSRCDWIIRQVDIRGWAHRLNVDTAAAVTRFDRLEVVETLFLRPVGLSDELTESYWEWVEDVILSEIKTEDPEWYRNLVEKYRNQISEIVAVQVKELRQQFGDVAGLEAEIARITSDYFPPLIRQSLLTDSQYLKKFGSGIQQILSFHEGTFASRRDHLFAAIRSILSGDRSVTVDDVYGNNWDLQQGNKKGDLPVLYVHRDEVRIVLPHFLFLSPTRDVRIRSFERSASEAHLPAQLKNEWIGTLRKRSLRDEEVAELLNQFQDTLGYTSNIISRELEKNNVLVSNLVPSSQKYYEGLVGSYSSEDSLDDYITKRLPDFLSDLSLRESSESLLVALLLSSHSGITKMISIEDISDYQFNEILSKLCDEGDRLSQLGAVEVGLRCVADRPAIESQVIELIRILSDDQGTHDASGYRLQGSLFKLVESELSSRHTFVTAPPFYRRLASLAHASVIHRQILRSGVDVSAFCDHLDQTYSLRFQVQSFIDMRLEPRWEPTFSSPIYLRSEFLSRIVGTGLEVLRDCEGWEIHEAVLADNGSSLHAQMEFPYWYFAGPLEGGRPWTGALPLDLVAEVKSQISGDQVTTRSFVALINGVFLGPIEQSTSKLASDALGRSRYRLRDVVDKNELINILYGLARVSAYSRDSELAGSLRVVSRYYRKDRQFSLTVDEEIRLLLMSSACSCGLREWCKSVGDWITELAFGGLEDHESRRLLRWTLQVLCDIVPALWSYCGAADAALASDDLVE